MSYAIDGTPNWVDTRSTVFIASEDVLAKWSSRVATPTDLLAFADADAQHVLDVIQRRRPQVVVLEQMFAATARGIALVNHLRSNPTLAGVDIRMLPADRSGALGATGPINGGMLTSMAQPLQHGPERRAQRIKMPNGAEVLIDGERTALIDLSTFGVQVVSDTILKPNQSVRVVINREGLVLRTRAAIAWSSLELARDAATYRAGVEFADVQPRLVAPGPVDLAQALLIAERPRARPPHEQ